MRVMLSKATEWWPEFILASVVVLVGATQSVANAAAVLIAVGIGWAMGIRHRRLPLHRRIDGLTDGVRELIRDVRSEHETAADEAAPRLRLVKR